MSSAAADRWTALSNEAADLLAKAKEYRKKMDSLPPGDPLRNEYDKIIRDLLQSASSISIAVRKGVRGA